VVGALAALVARVVLVVPGQRPRALAVAPAVAVVLERGVQQHQHRVRRPAAVAAVQGLRLPLVVQRRVVVAQRLAAVARQQVAVLQQLAAQPALLVGPRRAALV